MLTGAARKRPGGRGTKKRCRWCGLLGHRNTLRKPCENPQKQVTAAAERAEARTAREEAEARMQEKKDAKAKAQEQGGKGKGKASQKAAQSSSAKSHAADPSAAKPSAAKKVPSAAKPSAAKAATPKLQIDTAGTPEPKPSPRVAPRDRSDAKAWQEKATRIKSPARSRGVDCDNSALFGDEHNQFLSSPDATQKVNQDGEEEGEKEEKPTPRRSQRKKESGDEDEMLDMRSLRPGPTGNRQSIETSDKRTLQWNAGVCMNTCLRTHVYAHTYAHTHMMHMCAPRGTAVMK